jgi:hypothetical protein
MESPNSIVIGKRIPIGAAVGGLTGFLAHVWNLQNPDAQISVGAATGLSTALTATIQVAVVNVWGVTHASTPES